MRTGQFTLDAQNLRKALPVALVVAAGMGVLSLGIDLLAAIWGILLLAAWAYIGARYVDAVLASGDRPQILSVGINAAILTAMAGIAYELISWIMQGIRFPGLVNSPLDLYFVQAGIIGGLAACTWFAYKAETSKR
jgi:hypothetical protein